MDDAVMTIRESFGVRSYRKGSALAPVIVQAFSSGAPTGQSDGVTWIFLSDVISTLKKEGKLPAAVRNAAAHQMLARALPFEHEGLVYRLGQSAEPRKSMYEKRVRIERAPGRLEDVAPPVKSSTLDGRIERKMREIGGENNVFALREEAKRYMDGRFDRLETRIQELEQEVANLKLL